MESCAHYETNEIDNCARRRTVGKERSVNEGPLLLARRLCKCNHIVSHDEIILDNARVMYLFTNRFQQGDLHIGRMSPDYARFSLFSTYVSLETYPIF